MSLLGGRYETLQAIASGGMATVHLGRAVGVGGFERLVAIKIMHPHIAEEAEFVSMFLDEARLAARIRHPNVVATIDVQESDTDGLFLVMEYIEGPSLKSLRKGVWSEREMMPVDVVLRIMADVLSGLHAAHTLKGDEGESLKLVHRDVSPANVLIGSDGISRITDFGVARAETRLSSTREGKLKGKIPYMPPEQLMAEPVDHRADLYAAGVVLWECLVGRRLFKAPSEGALLQMILGGEHTPPSSFNPQVPALIDDICLRALSREPANRFATAADMAEAIEEAARSTGVGIATSRAVARFVEQSDIYEPLDPKKLSALKRAPMPSSPSLPGGPPTSNPSINTSPSSVTMTEAAISQRPHQLAPQARSRTGLWIGIGVAAIGMAVALFFAGRQQAVESAAPAAGDTSAVDVADEAAAPPAEPKDAPNGETSSQPGSEAGSEPSSQPAASAAASATAKAPARPATPPRAARRPPPRPAPKTTPKPGSTRYDPEQL